MESEVCVCGLELIGGQCPTPVCDGCEASNPDGGERDTVAPEVQAYIDRRNSDYDRHGLGIEHFSAYCVGHADGFEARESFAQDTPVDENGLKTCPFCTGTNLRFIPRGDEGDLFDLECGTAGCFLEGGADCWLPKEELVEAWNRRAK